MRSIGIFMVSMADITIPVAAQGHLRPVHAESDLAEVADLVELCFKDTLDPDGRSYLRQLRQAAVGNKVMQWALSAAEAVNGMPVAGYVWEERGRIIGNLSLIPLYYREKRIFLIANVAVHPDYRGRGIARMLTATAVEYTRRRKASTVWLQVREDNPSALHIYQALGFLEQARRTTWVCGRSDAIPAIPPEGYKVGRCRASHWDEQREWLKRLYPPELSWHLPVQWWLIRPGFWDRVRRIFSLEHPEQWAVERGNVLLAVLTSHFDGGHAATLWLAAPETGKVDELAVQAALIAARKTAGRHRPLSLNLPAGYAVTAVQSAGFQVQQTLLWMKIDF